MKRRKFLALTAALVLAATTGLASCGNNSGNKGDTKELNMILYPDYVPQSVIDSFEKETGIKCNIDYVDNDTLIYTKWSEDPKGYDIGQPAISTLHALIDADMLQETSYEDIPNSKYISTDKCDISLNDNDKKYSIPYNTTGGYTWIYNTKTCPVTITKWMIFLMKSFVVRSLQCLIRSCGIRQHLCTLDIQTPLQTKRRLLKQQNGSRSLLRT